MLEAYDRQLRELRTINQLNRVHIAYGNTVTPLEVLDLYTKLFRLPHHQMPELHPECQMSAEEVRRSAREWIKSAMLDLKPVGKSYLEPFLRRDIRKGLLFYSDGRPASGKSLLVTFAGANERLMMPIATFLQNINAATTDVLYLSDPSRAAYRHGLPGLAGRLQDIAAPLADLVDIAAYRRRVAIGVSAGGLPAVIGALAMKMDAVLGCGAPHPDRFDGGAIGGLKMAELLADLRAGSTGTKIFLAYGDDEAKDKAAAEALAKCVDPALELEVSFDGKKVQHNVLYPLSMNGSLPGFLNRLLGV